jgi:N-acetylmannosamine-6-phosphate 2-epimerase/N-acetylmannosamine kinase
VGAAVTGLVHDGEWSALNPATLGVPGRFPLLARLEAAFGVPALAANDAQAAAWAEYRLGAGGGEDMVFLTISTGIGGGVVLNGRLLGGLAGHFGLWRGQSDDRQSPLEDDVSGRWIAAEAGRAGHAGSAASVFAAAGTGAAWAQDIVAASASRVARLCRDIQLAFDPRRIVIGGGIGLADGYLDRVRSHLAALPPRLRPTVVPARSGRLAGVIGVASLAAAAL